MQTITQPNPNPPPNFDEAEIFGYTLKKGQLDIVGSVLDPEVTRLIVSATTQYGKTQAVAIGILTDLQSSDTPKKVLFIAPTIKQTNIIRNYVAELIADTPELSQLVNQVTKRGPEQLKNEMSKERLTFKNGWEIITLTAHGEEGGQDPGKQLMGFGGDIIVLDEACLILDEIYRKRIKRMLGSNPKAKLIILVNPWKKGHFAYKAWRSKRFRKIHIGYEQAITEGRVTRDFIEEQREDLTPIEFKVLYDSEFPDDNEDALIMWSWIEEATINKVTFTAPTYPIHSLDVAEKGTDLTILTDAVTDGENYQILKQTWVKVPQGDTMKTANRVSELVPKEDILNVDSIGVGAGVFSRLKELGYNVASIRVGESPYLNPERFENLKAQRWWTLRTLFEKRKIGIPNELKLMTQLSQMGYEITNKGKIKIIDPEGKSPDYADSLMLTPKSNKVSFEVSRGPNAYNT